MLATDIKYFPCLAGGYRRGDYSLRGISRGRRGLGSKY
jgi:hypothetical protein